MSNNSKYEYLKAIRLRYKYATRKQKTIILNEFCSVCGYHRKYAIWLLNATNPRKSKRQKKSGRKPVYKHPDILEVLMEIWQKAELPCATRLKEIIPIWLPHFEKFMISEEIKVKVLAMSASTIERIMAKHKPAFTKRGLATTKPGSIIKKQIPVKTKQWDETIPGFLEADTVAHCGASTEGSYVFSINCVDIATGWTMQRATWGKGQEGTLDAIKNIEKTLPFSIKGFDCDNGSEFLNWHLLRYLHDRKRPVQFTRARAYHKNDNAHIENKNWTHIRQMLGYQRFDNPKLKQLLNELYTSEWHDYFNYFIPSAKLISKKRVGSKIIKVHDKPKTPFQRLIESQHLDNKTKLLLLHYFNTLNPFKLHQQIVNKIKKIHKTLNKNQLGKNSEIESYLG